MEPTRPARRVAFSRYWPRAARAAIRSSQRRFATRLKVLPQKPTGSGILNGIPFGVKDIIEKKLRHARIFHAHGCRHARLLGRHGAFDGSHRRYTLGCSGSSSRRRAGHGRYVHAGAHPPSSRRSRDPLFVRDGLQIPVDRYDEALKYIAACKSTMTELFNHSDCGEVGATPQQSGGFCGLEREVHSAVQQRAGADGARVIRSAAAERETLGRLNTSFVVPRTGAIDLDRSA